MWRRINLQYRILLIVAGLTLLTISGGLLSLLYTSHSNSFLHDLMDRNLPVLETADRLEITLVMQKGYLTYFFLDGDPEWLKELERYNREFKINLAKARALASSPEETDIVGSIEREYRRLSVLRREVIEHYQAGRRERGFEIHKRARRVFSKIVDQTRRYRRIYATNMEMIRAEMTRRTQYMAGLASLAAPVVVILGALLAYILIKQVLGPIHRLTQNPAIAGSRSLDVDDVQAISRGVYSLLEDVDIARSELETSRVQLIQSAKLASLGKLAASVAHSVRNPLTSVKMRLFSLERNLQITDEQREDFKVISEEIRNIDNVLRNFLEFSRRPKLEIQRLTPSNVVDMALELIKPRLRSGRINLILNRAETLPDVNLDVAQLKEALVNLMVNASEAIESDGWIKIHELRIEDNIIGPAAAIRIQDSGPGVPESLRDQVFQPFFSTKSDGTGLGLSITARIVEEHGGRIELESPPEGGTTLTVMLPIQEVHFE